MIFCLPNVILLETWLKKRGHHLDNNKKKNSFIAREYLPWRVFCHHVVVGDMGKGARGRFIRTR